MRFIEVLGLIGGACGAIITITTFFTLILNKPKKWLQNIIRGAVKEENKEIKKEISTLKEQYQLSQESDIAILRHEITDIYEECMLKGYITVNKRKDLFSLYAEYDKNKGNSYIHDLMDGLKKMEVKIEN